MKVAKHVKDSNQNKIIRYDAMRLCYIIQLIEIEMLRIPVRNEYLKDDRYH